MHRSSTLDSIDDIGDRNAPIGSRLWSIAMVGMTRMAVERAGDSASHVGVMLGVLREHEVWKHVGLLSWSTMLADKFHISADQADALMNAKRGDLVGEVLAAKENPLPSEDQTENPRNPKGRKGKESGDNITRLERGTARTYTLRRLARDHPDLLDAVEAGTLSANAAAIKAGFRRKTFAVPVGDAAAALRAISKHYSLDDLRAVNDG